VRIVKRLSLALATGILAFLAIASSLRADIKLGMPFSDHMVLQADARVPVWGTAAPGEKVAVEFAGQKHTTVAAQDGKWRVTFNPMPASFEVAGDDGNFVPAKARITAYDKLTLTPPDGMTVKCVRYAWCDWFEPTLYNASGWPAGPFSISH
jgi:hypothetical protein